MENTIITAIAYAVRQASGTHAQADTHPKSEVPDRHNRKKISPSLTTWEVTLLTWPNLGGGATHLAQKGLLPPAASHSRARRGKNNTKNSETLCCEVRARLALTKTGATDLVESAGEDARRGGRKKIAQRKNPRAPGPASRIKQLRKACADHLKKRVKPLEKACA